YPGCPRLPALGSPALRTLSTRATRPVIPLTWDRSSGTPPTRAPPPLIRALTRTPPTRALLTRTPRSPLELRRRKGPPHDHPRTARRPGTHRPFGTASTRRDRGRPVARRAHHRPAGRGPTGPAGRRNRGADRAARPGQFRAAGGRRTIGARRVRRRRGPGGGAGRNHGALRVCVPRRDHRTDRRGGLHRGTRGLRGPHLC